MGTHNTEARWGSPEQRLRVRLGLLFLATGFLGFIVLLVVSALQPSTTAAIPRLGEEKVKRAIAPDFTLSLYNSGEEFRLSEQKGKIVVVNFWGSWCPPCRSEMPALQKVWEVYQGRGLVVVGVNAQDTEEQALAFLKEVGVTFPTGPDKDGSITTAYRVLGFPTTVFIDREGYTVHRWAGAITQERLTLLVEDLLQ